jgi:hypothetical protein
VTGSVGTAQNAAARRQRSHGAEVTIYRLLYSLDKWGDKFTPSERDEISHIIWALEEIQTGAR